MAELPLIDPDDLGPPERDGPVVGVLLAAGTSSRFGEANKLLAEVDGEPLLRRALAPLLAPDVALKSVVVVVGHEADRVRAVLADAPVTTVENPEYAAGQATSVRTGVRAARERDARAALFALGDMPDVAPASVRALITAYRAGAGDALAAAHAGERGNPVVFDRRFFDALADVEGDTGGRRLLVESDAAALIETGDPGVRRDVDTVGDLPDA